MVRKWTIRVPPGVPERADKALVKCLEDEDSIPPLSRSQIQRLMDAGKITIEGRPVRGKDFLAPGCEVDLEIPEPVALSLEPEEIPIELLYEDEHLLVVNKQPGLTVHPSDTCPSGTLVNALLFHIRDLSGIGGVLRPGIVHRIDKDTSGALVISKSDAAHAGLSALFARHDIERRYWALCYGAPSWGAEYPFESLLGRHPQDRKKMMVNPPLGKRAASRFQLLEAYGLPGKNLFASMIEARLETGRTHQVRAHLTHLHHSLLGDPVYGMPSEGQSKWKNLPPSIREKVQALPGQALHARILGFRHPITGIDLYFEAPPPRAFQALLETLRKFS